MNRRSFLAGSAAAFAAMPSHSRASAVCGCSPLVNSALGSDAFRDVSSGLKITNLKVFGVSLTPDSDRPYVFVKLETNQGLVGWGEGTLEGKAQAVMSCVQDFRDFLIGSDPMQVEHHWQSMYVHSFYRAGPVIGSAISGIDQALWDIRGKALNMPVYQILGGPHDSRGVRGYYHTNAKTKEEVARLRETALQEGISCFKTGLPEYYEWIETHDKIERGYSVDSALARRLGRCHRYRGGFSCQNKPQRGLDHCEECGAAEPAFRGRTVSTGKRSGDGPNREPIYDAHRHGRAPGRCLWLPRVD